VLGIVLGIGNIKQKKGLAIYGKPLSLLWRAIGDYFKTFLRELSEEMIDKITDMVS
jgi:hypothetical protein